MYLRPIQQSQNKKKHPKTATTHTHRPSPYLPLLIPIFLCLTLTATATTTTAGRNTIIDPPLSLQIITTPETIPPDVVFEIGDVLNEYAEKKLNERYDGYIYNVVYVQFDIEVGKMLGPFSSDNNRRMVSSSTNDEPDDERDVVPRNGAARGSSIHQNQPPPPPPVVVPQHRQTTAATSYGTELILRGIIRFSSPLPHPLSSVMDSLLDAFRDYDSLRLALTEANIEGIRLETLRVVVMVYDPDESSAWPTMIPNGGDEGSSSVGHNSGLPSERPSGLPLQIVGCQNDKNYRLAIGKKCAWIGKKESRKGKWCSEVSNGRKVNEACPIICGVCYEDDPEYTFLANGQTRKCGWIGTKEKKIKYCDKIHEGILVGRHCRGSCRIVVNKALFRYDDEKGYFNQKTQSYMPYMPALDGHMKTHDTYRFLSVREQVATLIGEAKHGLWMQQESGIVRLYRKYKTRGVPVGADVYNATLQEHINNHYKAVLEPGDETGDKVGWAGYRYAQDDDGDGRAAFVDVDIYHPYFNGAYDDHPVIDLPIFICSMSDYNFKEASDIWNYIKMQPNANNIGPLGQRAGLDITEHYTNVIKLDFFPDARMWIQVGMGISESNDVFDQNDIDNENMSMDVAYRALDTSKANYEVYLVERPSWNVPYLHIVVVVDNKENDDLRYTRPAGLYWDKLFEKGLTGGIKTEVTYDPSMPVIANDGTPFTKIMRYTPISALNILDDYGYGNWCPQRGGDWYRYPRNPSGSGWPNQYEEVTPICDAFVVDVKMFANLDKPTWDSPLFQLQNAGAADIMQTYISVGNQYGDFIDPYLVNNGFQNPHALHFTTKSNPRNLPIQGIDVTFEGVGETNQYVDPEDGRLKPKHGLTNQEKRGRNQRMGKIGLNV